MQVCYRSYQARVRDGVRHWHLWATPTKVRRWEFGATPCTSHMLLLLLSLLLKNSHDSGKLEKKNNMIQMIQTQEQFRSNSYSYVHNCGGLNPDPHLIFTLQEQMTTNSIFAIVVLCCLCCYTSNYSIISCGTSTQISSLSWSKRDVCQSSSFRKFIWLSNIAVYKLQWVKKMHKSRLLCKLFLWSCMLPSIKYLFKHMGYWTILVIDYTEWSL